MDAVTKLQRRAKTQCIQRKDVPWRYTTQHGKG